MNDYEKAFNKLKDAQTAIEDAHELLKPSENMWTEKKQLRLEIVCEQLYALILFMHE